MIKIVLSSVLLLSIFHSPAQSLTENYLEVTATTEKEITPDKVEVTVVLKAHENVKKENELQEKEKQILAALMQFDILESDISIDKVAGHRYGYYKTTSNKYQISKVYKIQLNTITFLDDLIIRLFETGASNVFISKMTSNSWDEIKTIAAKEALEIARKRAQEIANTMKIEIGDPIQVKELPAGTMDWSLPYRADRLFYQAQGLTDCQQMGTENLSVRKILLTYAVSVRFAIN